MRRIIERVVTVVTTTTWKISWEADARHSNHQVDPVANELPVPDDLSETVYDTQTKSDVVLTKEVDLPNREEKMIDPTVEEPPQKSYSYPTNIERKPNP